AVKAGGMRVPKKHEYGPVGKNAKPPGKDKTRYSIFYNNFPPLHPLMLQMNHKINAAALQVAQQKPQPALEKFILPKRIYIIQQPRKC
ncbi:DAPL1 protein, partial [Amazona guildingii]|nr:DAPL1 protein [Amazona guildingii]